MAWLVLLHAEVEAWFLRLCVADPERADGVSDAIDTLADLGPTLGRPLVDRIHGSTYHHSKELRPPSAGSTEVRILFAFDPERHALLVVAGDKAGRWSRWYDHAIPLAERRYQEHLRALSDRREQP